MTATSRSAVFLALALLAALSRGALAANGRSESGPTAPAVHAGPAVNAAAAPSVKSPAAGQGTVKTGVGVEPGLPASTISGAAQSETAPVGETLDAAVLNYEAPPALGDASPDAAAAALITSAGAERVADVKKANGVAATLTSWLKIRRAPAVEASAGSAAAPLAQSAVAARAAATTSVPAPLDSSSNWKAATEKVGALRAAGFAAAVSGAAFEFLQLAMSPFLQNAFNDFSLAAELGIIGSLASVVGRQLGPLVVNRSTLKGGYTVLTVPMIALALAIALYAAFGLAPTLGVIGLFALIVPFRGFLAASAASERAIPPQILEQDNRKLQSFRGWKQQWVEVGSTWTQVIGGALLAAGASLSVMANTVAASLGATFSVTIDPVLINLFLAPVLFGVSLMMILGMRVPARIEAARKAVQDAQKAERQAAKAAAKAAWSAKTPRQKAAALFAALKPALLSGMIVGAAVGALQLAAYFFAAPLLGSLGLMAGGVWAVWTAAKFALPRFIEDVERGAKLVMGNKTLRAFFIVSAIFMLLNVAVYGLLAPAFAYYVTFGSVVLPAGASASAAGPVMGLVAALYSFGGLYAGLRLPAEQKKLDRKMVARIEALKAAGLEAKAAQAQASQETEKANHKSTLRWLGYAAASFLLLGVFALPFPAIVAALGLPASVLSPLISPAMIAAGLGVVGLPAWIGLPLTVAVGTITALKFPKLGLAVVMVPMFLAFPLNVALASLAMFALGMIITVATMKTDSAYETAAPSDMIADAQGFIGAGSMLGGMVGLVGLKFLFSGKLPFGLGQVVDSFTGLHGVAAFVWITGGAALLGLGVAYAAWRLFEIMKVKASEANA